MNKKNKGFTLIEVLATIAIIAVVTLIATIAYGRIRTGLLNREYNNLKSLIETAGVKYTSKTGYTAYFVRDLIEEGYLEPDDDSNNIYDPRNHESLNCHIVEVKKDKNMNYIASLGTKSFLLNDGCDENRVQKIVNDIAMTALITTTNINYLTTTNASEIGAKSTTKSNNIYSGINIVINQGSRWTNKQLDITAEILAPSGNLPYYVDMIGARYIWNKNTDTTTIEPNRTHTTNVFEFFDGYYYLDVYTKENKHLQSKITYKYDKQKPILYGKKTRYANPLDENIWKKSKVLLIYATDKDGVGLDRVYAGIRPCEDLLKDPNLGTAAVPNSQVHTYNVNDVEAGINGENGEINICVVDKLGNLSSDKFTVKKIDVTPPQCARVTGDHDKYQWEARTVKQYCYDNNTINGKNVIGSGCTNGDNPYPKTWDTTTKVGTIRITDNVGWTTDCPVNVYVDRTPPICAYTTGNTQSHKNNNGATTLGIGTTDNWDQNYRHVTQYCADKHVGCKVDSVSKDWEWSQANPQIATGTITIKDKVPRCSQESETGYCVNYETIKNTDDNLYSKNQSTVCTVGVYIDHVPPVASMESGSGVHSGNRIRFVCSDPSVNGVAGSGVISFKASATTQGSTTINPCHSAGDCSTSYGPEISNNDGGKLQFKILSSQTVINYPRDNILVSTYCEDKAHNIERRNQENSNNFEVSLYLADSVDHNEYVTTNGLGKSIGPCSTGCKLRTFRPAQGQSCQQFSYECSCTDSACASKDNVGEGSTCCLSGADPKWGCKKWSNTITSFSSRLDYQEYEGSQGHVSYIKYNNKYYIKPNRNIPSEEDDYDEYCNNSGCTGGYECLVFNCYPDNPYGNSLPSNTVCGNYTK